MTAAPTPSPNRCRSPAGPLGGVPDAVAVFGDRAGIHVGLGHRVRRRTRRRSTPAPTIATGHVTADRPGSGSVTPTDVSVTLPVLVTRNEYATVSPAAVTVGRRRRLHHADRRRLRQPITVAESLSVTGSAQPAASRRRRRVHDRAGIHVGLGHRVASPNTSSSRPAPTTRPDTSRPTDPAADRPRRRDVSVTLPVFVTRNEYATVCTSGRDRRGTADFTTSIEGVCVAVTVADVGVGHRSAHSAACPTPSPCSGSCRHPRRPGSPM